MHKSENDYSNQECESSSENSKSIVLRVKSNSSLPKQKRTLSAAVPVLVRVAGSTTLHRTYVALDNWASDCFISGELLDRIGGNGKPGKIQLSTMRDTSFVKTKTVSHLELFDSSMAMKYSLPNVYSIDNWPFGPDDVPSADLTQQFEHLQGIEFGFIEENIGLLIGANMPELLKPLETISGSGGEPFAVRYSLGWAITGPTCVDTLRVSCHRIKVKNHKEIDENISQLFARDFLDIEPNVKGYSVEDRAWLKKAWESLKIRNDGHYEISLPFRCKDTSMPCNYKQALSCFKSLRHRFEKNPSYFADYKAFVDNMIDKGYLELVPDSEISVPDGKCWYLVHHGVYHKTKNKIRVVFDCSKKNAGVSLNDKLLKGPDLTNSLMGVLLKFRTNKIAIIADIESMFLQVKVPSYETNFLRVFWCSSDDSSVISVYRLTCHTFGAVCSPSVANFAFQNTAIQNKNSISKRAFDTITESTYVDDLMCGAPSVSEAVDLAKELRAIAATAGFNLTGIVSNSREVLLSFPSEALGKSLKQIDLKNGELPNNAALGVSWNIEDDCFLFEAKISKISSTRRGMLSVISSVFDPLGLISPVIVVARSLFQETCRRGLSWDDTLPDDIRLIWNNWLTNLEMLKVIKFSRYIGNEKINLNQVQIFCDGSLTAYGAVAYLRTVGLDGNVSCKLIMAKVRQTPIDNGSLRTVPRIELNAAKVAVLLGVTIKKDILDSSRIIYWSDSMTVIKYIKNETVRFHIFVENRINFIRSHTCPTDWRHVPGELNVADVLSRGLNVSQLRECSAWISGPQFLYSDEACWPNNNLDTAMEDDIEMCKELRVAATVRKSDPITTLLDGSEWFKILYRVAVLVSFCHFMRGKIIRPFSFENISDAEKFIWRYIQANCFSDQIRRINNGNYILKGDALSKLSPIIDDTGILRVGGRLQNSIESYSAVHPVILPGKNDLVRLLVENFHCRFGHMGKNHLVSCLRSKYWIINLNYVVKKVLYSCLHCRKQNSRNSEVTMSNLPADRVTIGTGLPPTL